MMRITAIALLLTVCSGAMLRSASRAKEDCPTPEDDGAFPTQAAACAACKCAATASCAMYKTCTCYATNAHFDVFGIPANDTTNFHWSCGGEGGDKYQLCFHVDQVNMDSFGDMVDPHNPKCP
mmetsp:Transcript_55095/g.131293  ORF Transcript_55095/g.131293 Transcript_55095/m.131293 type:complete len:123 (-) Transcript_55095:98-466(-)|eukprot:CAMPEP_0178433190 /NCGR_PEP_ID=MMETSP0689_2-20121128/32776_1 /TAXON_ID=160604 /ORGANISM="Amphidinium massartii, Strain CS-259" /LENGTH=122 /DNA_ID=CAMNT_0020055207 /DNA_START=76 /DNA_END=444 /DNA_ORIENTATION=+